MIPQRVKRVSSDPKPRPCLQSPACDTDVPIQRTCFKDGKLIFYLLCQRVSDSVDSIQSKRFLRFGLIPGIHSFHSIADDIILREGMNSTELILEHRADEVNPPCRRRASVHRSQELNRYARRKRSPERYRIIL
jgi:hypothetical protein